MSWREVPTTIRPQVIQILKDILKLNFKRKYILEFADTLLKKPKKIAKKPKKIAKKPIKKIAKKPIKKIANNNLKNDEKSDYFFI